MYCLSVIESAMNRSPPTTASLSTTSGRSLADYHLNMKSILMKYLLTGYHVLPPFIVNKTAKLLVGIGKINFPSSDPEFLERHLCFGTSQGILFRWIVATSNTLGRVYTDQRGRCLLKSEG